MMANERATDSPVKAFINKHPHSSDCFQYFELACFYDSNHLFPLHRGKRFQEIID